ncbi:hypothetical protein MWU52_15510 [Jannaschia sp. S6380]|uniref:hypothetical protein n=1 Tax=Jannaschia sp. S6380 TaxID=2926408 RepID=UPI001FF26123|nr:hypothetical protein [Jannaschia sp. S6380]MCK0168962.1 hypothetical protein [Jannaschia sp. S6380]
MAAFLLVVLANGAAADPRLSPGFELCHLEDVAAAATAVEQALIDQAECDGDMACIMERATAGGIDRMDCASEELMRCDARADAPDCFAAVGDALSKRVARRAEALDVERYIALAGSLSEPERGQMVGALQSLMNPLPTDCGLVPPLETSAGTLDAARSCTLIARLQWHATLISAEAHLYRLDAATH